MQPSSSTIQDPGSNSWLPQWESDFLQRPGWEMPLVLPSGRVRHQGPNRNVGSGWGIALLYDMKLRHQIVRNL